MACSRTFKIVWTAASIAVTSGLITNYAMSQSRHNRHPDSYDNQVTEQQFIRDAVARGEVMPLPKILVIAQKAVPGDIIDVELEQKEWGIKYELKILTTAGRVRKLDINARTGAIVKIGDD